jgi:ubiquinone/menaquinone biosynthesis C-methylase UbiE
VQILDATPELAGQWDALVRASADGWVFGLSGWQRLILQVSEWELRDLSFAARQDGRLLGVMPLQVDPHGRVASSGFGGSGPVLAEGLAAGQRSRLLATLLQEAEARARAAGGRELGFQLQAVTRSALANERGVNPFVELGFEDVSSLTRVVDLELPEESLWRGLSADARQQVQRARRLGYRAERGHWPELVDEYYRVHVETYRRTGVSPHPKAYFAGIAAEMAGAGHAALWVGRAPDGRAVAFHNDARLGAGSLYHTGCAETAHLDSGVNYLLFWHALLDARKEGCIAYEVGEIFPAARDGKERGLTVFKNKFGGTVHRLLRARRVLEPGAELPAPAPPPSRRAALRSWIGATRSLGRALLRPAEPPPPSAVAERIESSRHAFRESETYRADAICIPVRTGASEYVDRLLARKLELIREHAQPGLWVDLCCGTGEHLFALAEEGQPGIGIDFSPRYLERAEETRRRLGRTQLAFACGDATRLPLATGSVDTLWCLSALYAMPGVREAFPEIARVLRPGGVCVLDLGNRRSLNAICVRAYRDLAPQSHLALSEMRALCAESGLVVSEHRAFQILPLWASKPRWLWPLLHPFWKRLLARRLAGRMLDEHLSNLPGLRAFAFRHLLVCRRAP